MLLHSVILLYFTDITSFKTTMAVKAIYILVLIVVVFEISKAWPVFGYMKKPGLKRNEEHKLHLIDQLATPVKRMDWSNQMNIKVQFSTPWEPLNPKELFKKR